MPSRTLPVPEALEGERADVAISRVLGLTRSAAAEVIASGGAMLDGKVLMKSDRLTAGKLLEVTWYEKQPLVVQPQAIADMSIVFQDEDLVVVNKPVGVAAHPAVSWDGPTVLGGLAAAGIKVASGGPPERTGIVQRLDVGTSGLMVVAKSEIAYSRLKRAFKERTVSKTYHALVQGLLDPLAGTIDAPVGRHPKSDWKFAVTATGKHAVTHYETLEAFRFASLVEVHLETGRTHQIRVHMSHQRHPLVGDPLYGSDPKLASRLGLTRQWLHAVNLSFAHPTTGEIVFFASDYPEDLALALKILEAD